MAVNCGYLTAVVLKSSVLHEERGWDTSWTFLVLPTITFYHCYQIVCQPTMRYVNDLQVILWRVSAVIILSLSQW